MNSFNSNQGTSNPGEVTQIYCPNCRGGNSPDAGFCIWCGHNLAVSNSPQIVCSSCNGSNPSVARNCMWCGASLDTSHGDLAYGNQQSQNYQSGQPTTQMVTYHQSTSAAHQYQQPNQYQQPPQPILVQTHQTVVVTGNQKSVGAAILLTFLFGPLGMFYSTVGGAIFMLFLSIILSVLTLGVSIPFTWLACIIWGAVAADSTNKQILAQTQHYTNYPPGTYVR